MHGDKTAKINKATGGIKMPIYVTFTIKQPQKSSTPALWSLADKPVPKPQRSEILQKGSKHKPLVEDYKFLISL